MTIKELSKLVGREGTILAGLGGISIPVRVVDVRQVYGRTEALVQPHAGDGEAWVELGRVVLT